MFIVIFSRMSGRFDQVPLINKTDDKDYFIRTSLHDPGEDVHDVFIREHMWRKQKCCRILGLIASVLLVIVATASIAYYFLFLQNAKVVEPPSPPNQHQAQGTGGAKTEEIIVEVTNNFNGDNEKKPGLDNEIVGTDKDSSEDTEDLYKFEYKEDMDEKEDMSDEASDFESHSTEYNDNSDSSDEGVSKKASKESSEVVELAYVDGAEEPIKTDINKDTNDVEYLNNGHRSSNGDDTDFGDNLHQSESREEGNQEGTVNSNWVDTTDNGNDDITSGRSDNDEKSLLNSYPYKNTDDTDFGQYLETSDSSEENPNKSPRIGESYRTESRESAFGEEDKVHTENDAPLLNSKEMTDKAKGYYIDSGDLEKEGSMEEDDDVWSRIFGSDKEQNEDTYTYNSEDGGSFGYSKLWQDSEGKVANY